MDGFLLRTLKNVWNQHWNQRFSRKMWPNSKENKKKMAVLKKQNFSDAYYG